MTHSDVPLARTPLHEWHAAHGAAFITSNGWQVPDRYPRTSETVNIFLHPVLIADISANAKLSVVGRGVDAFAAKLLGLSPIRNPRGACDLEPSSRDWACRLTTTSLLLLARTTDAAGFAERIGQASDVVCTDVTSANAGFVLRGPRAADLLQKITSLDVSVSAFPRQSCTETNLAGVPALLVRPRRAGEDEILVYVGSDVGEYTWERLCEAGAAFNLLPIGALQWYLNFAGPSG